MAVLKGGILPHLTQGKSFLPKPMAFYQGVWRLNENKAWEKGKVTGQEVAHFRQTIKGHIIPSPYDWFYDKVYLLPSVINLGNFSGEQVVTVRLWNAKKIPLTLTHLSLSQIDGVVLQHDPLPKTLKALESFKVVVTISDNGSPVLDGEVLFHLQGEAARVLTILGNRTVPWRYFPNWHNPVSERLCFLTQVLQSITGAEQRTAKRLSPRRTFDFSLCLEEAEANHFSQLLFRYSDKVFDVPLFTQAVLLETALVAGFTKIPLETAGLDIAEGGRILLKMGEVESSAEIIRIDPSQLVLKNPVPLSFAAGTMLYPLRSMILTDMPTLTYLSDAALQTEVRLQVAEHNPFNQKRQNFSEYRGKPILEPIGDFSEDVTHQYLRLRQQLDNQTGLPFYYDSAKASFFVQKHHFIFKNREALTRFRQLFYDVKGRRGTVWVATGMKVKKKEGD